MRKIFISALFIINFSLIPVMAQTPPRPSVDEAAWRILEKAEVAFDNGKYDEALRYSNLAKINHKKEIDWQLYVFNRSTTPAAVRHAGDELRDVLEILKERDEYICVQLIENYIDLYGINFFDNSIRKMIEWVGASVVYPEADYLLGKIFQLEGEFELAKEYYESARKNAAFLDIPDTIYEILYSMAELAVTSQDEEEYEQVLLYILSENKYFNDELFVKSVFRTIDSEKKDSFNRVFNLYRGNCDFTLKALYYLMNLEKRRGNNDKALRCAAVASISIFSHIFDSVSSRDSEFKYSTFGKFLTDFSEYEDIVSWCDNNFVWEFFFNFVLLSENRGAVKFALSGFETIRDYCPKTYWQKEAENHLLGN